MIENALIKHLLYPSKQIDGGSLHPKKQNASRILRILQPSKNLQLEIVC